MSQLGAIDAGTHFQLLQTMDCCLRMMFLPERYEWVMMERTNEAQKLDDVLVMRKEPGDREVLEAYQCKHAMRPEDAGQAVTWDWLLADKKGRSLLQQWADSVDHLQKRYPDIEAYIVTNRIASPEVLVQTEFVAFEQITAPHRDRIIAQLGSEARARTILSIIRFRFGQSSLETWTANLKQQLKLRHFRDTGWASLFERAHRWLQRGVPGDGAIRLNDVKAAVGWYHLQALDQNFPMYSDYVEPDGGTDSADFVARVAAARTGVLVISGPPGSGKSTLLSKLVERLADKQRAVVRHHYYLRPGQQIGDRFSHRRVIEALMSQIMDVAKHALGDLLQENPDPANFAAWLDQCGKYFHDNGDALVLIVDGLDHVYREQKSTSELDALFRELLPLRAGIVVVVGTQKVDDPRLPHLLLQHCPKEKWTFTSGLSINGVRTWIQSQTDADGLPAAQLTNLTTQLHAKTAGHPLVLRYSWDYLVLTGQTTAEAPTLPHVPKSGVDEYYQWLWLELPEYAREVLHLLAACDWLWTPGEVIACLDPNGSRGPELAEGLRRIAHLLNTTDGRLRPFHSSLLFFVVDRPEHPVHAERLRKLVLTWLRTSGREYLRWAYEWRLEASLGDPGPLCAGPSLDWAVNALAQCYPLAEVDAIMTEAASEAAKAGDLGRWAELSLIQERLATFPPAIRANWLWFRLSATNDAALADLLVARRTTLSNDELRALGGYLQEQGDGQRLDLCRQELTSRPTKAQSSSSPVDWSTEQTNNVDYPELARQRRIPEALGILNDLQALPTRERLAALRYLVPMLCLEGVALPPLGEAEPLSLLFLGMQTKTWSSSLELGAVDVENAGWPGQFYRFLLNALAGQEERTALWLARLPAERWETEAHRCFAQLAARLAPQIREGVPVSPAAMVLEANRCGLGTVIRDPPVPQFAHAPRGAMEEITLALFDLQRLNFVTPLANQADLQAALATGLVRGYSWAIKFNLQGVRWLADEAFTWWCGQPERPMQWLIWWEELFRLAMLHERPTDVPRLMEHAAAEFFGFQADDHARTLAQVLKRLDLIDLAQQERKELVKARLIRALPVSIAAREARTGEAIALATAQAFLKVDPVGALQLYHWFLQQPNGEHLAAGALACLMGALDLDSSQIAAVAATATTSAALTALERRAKSGNATAQALWNDAVAWFGLPTRADEEEDEADPFAGVIPEGVTVDVAQFPPDRVQEFLEAIRFPAEFNEQVASWIRFWQQQGLGPVPAEALQRAARAMGVRVASTLFAVHAASVGAGKAYPWLVQMLLESSSYSGDESAFKAGQLVLRSFPDRWLTLARAVLSPTVAAPKVSDRIGILIAYLTGAGRHEVAFSVFQGAFRFLLKSIDLAAIPAPVWQDDPVLRDLAVAILLTRLGSKSATVRERACTALAKLLLGDDRVAVERRLLLHAAAERLESRALLPLLVWLRGRTLDPTLRLPSGDTLHALCPRWSFAAALLVEELGVSSARSPVPAHSDDAPIDFVPDRAFSIYLPRFLPDGVWRELPAKVDLNDPVIRQWAYEWELLHGREHVNESPWTSSPTEQLLDDGRTDQSTDVYTSALLRAIAWAFAAGHLSEEDARRRAARCLPVDMALWQVMPNRPPQWWPWLPHGMHELSEVARRIEFALAADMPALSENREWQLVYASGTVAGHDCDFRLQLGVDFVPEKPKGYARWTAELTTLWAGGCLQYHRHDDERSEDAPVTMAAAIPLRLSTYPSWQWWRSAEHLRAPSPLFSPAGVAVVPVANGVEFRTPEGALVAVWSDWTDGIRDDDDREFPGAGAILMVRSDLVRQVTETTNTRLTWRADLGGNVDERDTGWHGFTGVSLDLQPRRAGAEQLGSNMQPSSTSD